MDFNRGEVRDDRLSIVGSTGAADFVEVRVKEFFEPGAAAPYSGVMEFDFKTLEFGEQ